MDFCGIRFLLLLLNSPKYLFFSVSNERAKQKTTEQPNYTNCTHVMLAEGIGRSNLAAMKSGVSMVCISGIMPRAETEVVIYWRGHGWSDRACQTQQDST